MIETFFVFSTIDVGEALWAHRVLSSRGWSILGRELLTDAGVHDGHRSTERIGVATASIPAGYLLEVRGPDLVAQHSRCVVGKIVAKPPPLDDLLCSALERETAAIGKGYVPEKHTDFDVEHGWRITMEMGRGG